MRWGVLISVFLLISIGLSYGKEITIIDHDVYTALEDQSYVPVIIELKETLDITSTQEAVLNRLSLEEFNFRHRLTSQSTLIGDISLKGVEELKKDRRVKSIYFDAPIHLTLDISVPKIDAPLLYNRTINNTFLNGSGETICILDTGIDYTHSGFGNCTNSSVQDGTCHKIKAMYDFHNNDLDGYDDNGHGTHVAGIAASTDQNYTGVAPGAAIVAIKILGSDGSGSVSNLISGIDWCRSNATKYNISIISMSVSISGAENSTYCDSEGGAVFSANQAANAGLFVVASAGNNGYSDKIANPACASNVTSVGSTTINDAKSSFSNAASILNLFAPGEDITSLKAMDGALTGCSNSGLYSSCSGTSQAAPHVAGAATLLLQYKRQESNHILTTSELRSAFKDTGFNVTLSNGTNISRLNVWNALISIDSRYPDFTVFISNLTVVHGRDNVSINFNVKDTTLRTSYINITFSNGSLLTQLTTNATLTPTNLSVKDVYTITLFARDEAGNQNITNYSLNVIDGSSPEVILNNPTEGSVIGTNSVTLNCSYTDDTNLNNLTFYHNISQSFGSAEKFNISGTNGSRNVTYTSLNDGGYLWNCLATDTEGNKNFGDINRTFFIDTTNPTVTLNNPADGASFTSSSVTLTYTVSDVSSIANCSLLLEGAINTTDPSITKDIDQSFSNISFSKGDYSWSVRCYDPLNHFQTSNSRTFSVSTTSGGGGGGGGGGGEDSDSNSNSDEDNSNPIEKDVDLGELGDSEVERTLTRSGTITFSVDTKKYELKIKEIGGNYAILTIGDLELLIQEGSEKDIDLDGDSVGDIHFGLDSIVGFASIDLRIKRLNSLDSITGGVSKNNDNTSLDLLKDSSNLDSLAIVLLGILTIGILEYYMFRALMFNKQGPKILTPGPHNRFGKR